MAFFRWAPPGDRLNPAQILRISRFSGATGNGRGVTRGACALRECPHPVPGPPWRHVRQGEGERFTVGKISFTEGCHGVWGIGNRYFQTLGGGFAQVNRPRCAPHTPRRTHAPKPWRVFRCRCRFFLPFFQPVHADHARRSSGSDRQSRHHAGAAAVKISSRARSRQLSGLPLGLHFCGVSCCKGVGGIATL